MRLPKKLPIPLAAVLLLFVVGGAILFFEGVARFPSITLGEIKPENITISNITDTKFTVTWTTKDPATGALVVHSDDMPAQTVPDERDTTGSAGKYVTHSVTFSGGKPQRSYQFTIVSNGKEFTSAEDNLYALQTGPTLSNPPDSLEPAFGEITTADGSAAEGSLVYAQVQGGQLLSTRVSSSGSWIIPLNIARTAQLDTYIPPQERLAVQITVRDNTLETQATTDSLNDSPVPTIVLGKSYDFRNQQADAAQADVVDAANAPESGFDSVSTDGVLGTRDYAVRLLSPAQNAALSSQKPLITGTGLPGKLVTVTLGIEAPVTSTTRVETDGHWRLTPEKNLSPGKQSVTITTLGDDGLPVALTHTFRIFESGTQVLGDATPSATLTPTATPTSTISATPSPTDVPTPTSTQSAQEVPTTGTTLPTILLLIVGIVLVFSGALVLL